MAALALLSACGTRAPDGANRADRQPAAPRQQNTSVTPDSSSRSGFPAPDPGTTQSGSAITYYSASTLRRLGDGLAQSGVSGRSVGDSPRYRVVVSRRAMTGEPEIHDAWIDVTFVQAGGAVLLTGGQVSGGRLVSAGEHRGGTMNGGQQQPLTAGDLFLVPAGVPHQFRLARGDTIRYLTVKVPRQ